MIRSDVPSEQRATPAAAPTRPAPAGPPAPPLPAHSSPAPGYEVLAHLTRTGWLDVYDVWSHERDCRCVLKILRPDRRHEQRLRDRLLREGRWLQTFTHPHLVRGYETMENPEPTVILETLSGETLDHLIYRLHRRLPATDLAFLGQHLCSALHYLHGQGLLHLDVKPSNVVIDCRRAKLLDLSVARPPGPAPAGVGTPCYLAPEQARGEPLTTAADVWGLGITLYEAATGDIPFHTGDTEATTYTSGEGFEGHLDTGPGPSPSGTYGRSDRYPQTEGRAAPVLTRRRLPRELAAAIDACLEPHPAARPAIDRLAEEFDAMLPTSRRDVQPSPPQVPAGQSISARATY